MQSTPATATKSIQQAFRCIGSSTASHYAAADGAAASSPIRRQQRHRSLDVQEEAGELQALFKVAAWVAGQRQLVAAKDLVPGQVVWHASNQPDLISMMPDRYSVQVGADRHFDIMTACPGSELAQHGCDANGRLSFQYDSSTMVDTEAKLLSVSLVVKVPIKAGETVSFNYNATEWDMSDPFDCECGSDQCVGRVQGCSALSQDQQRTIVGEMSPYILNRYRELLQSSKMSTP